MRHPLADISIKFIIAIIDDDVAMFEKYRLIGSNLIELAPFIHFEDEYVPLKVDDVEKTLQFNHLLQWRINLSSKWSKSSLPNFSGRFLSSPYEDLKRNICFLLVTLVFEQVATNSGI